MGVLNYSKKDKSVKIQCLKCHEDFMSTDRVYNRLCKNCKASNNRAVDLDEMMFKKGKGATS